MKGRLFGVGVGPGDPELMTYKAVRTIEKCPVIAFLSVLVSSLKYLFLKNILENFRFF